MKYISKKVAWGTGLAFVLGTCLFASTVWSAPGDKKQLRKDIPEVGVLDRDQVLSKKDVKKPSVKRKVVKKAGTAAVVGVATSKASKGLRKKGLKKEEK
jgi:hypothetical protein